MEMQGIPVTMANLAIHRQREEKMNQERMRYDQILQEAAVQQVKEANKGKARELVPDSEEEFVSSESEECQLVRDCRLNTHSKEPPCNRAFKVKKRTPKEQEKLVGEEVIEMKKRLHNNP
ncbi:hypothetical protein PIB30_068659 [Stylosanthes scabra]|uniref:Uncharacterized protein n=1 Tax=Stylosanthes scabra TaxID=79078 RepID=A0ABU6QMH6_9FABA|nr:hypothetical protein [Stylosanthes scabra]